MSSNDEFILDLSFQNLNSIPEEVLSKTSLKWLYLEGNEIENLPEDFFLILDQLTWLDLRNNKLKSIPESIKDHPCLETLLLQNNNIEVLPLELGLVPNLKTLHLSGNPIKYPDKVTLNCGTDVIKQQLLLDYNKKYLVESTESFSEVDDEKSEYSVILSNTDNVNPVQDIPVKEKSPEEIIHEKRIREASSKDYWCHKLRKIMMIQDRTLQRKRNSDAIKKWKNSRKFHKKPDKLYNIYLPYGSYEEYNKMPSRHDLLTKIDSVKVLRKPKEVVDINKLISEIVHEMNQFKQNTNEKRSPRSEMYEAEREIKQMMELQKKLSSLKLTNYGRI